ncbi:NHL repeat-containing protein, partial [Spirochaetota bacterium]
HDDVKKINSYIKKSSQLSGLGMNTPIAVCNNADNPFFWYARDFNRRSMFNENSIPPADAYVVVADWGKHQQYEYLFADNYVMQRMKLRAWTVLPNLNTSKITLGQKIKYLLVRFNRDNVTLAGEGSLDAAVFVRKDIYKDEYDDDLGKDMTQKELSEKAKALRPITIASSAAWGSFGSGNEQFNEPRDIAFGHDGSMYVTDMKNHRIVHLDRNGNHISAWGSKGGSDGQFNTPIGIAADREGNIFVADTWNHRIQKFSASGAFIAQWGRGGCASGGSELWAPKGIAFDSKGFLYVVNTGCHRIHAFDRTGRFIKMQGFKSVENTAQLNGFFEPVGIFINKNDEIFICDTANHRVVVYNTSLAAKRKFKIIGWVEFYTEPFISIDTAGRCYVSDAFNNRIIVYDNEGSLLRVWGTAGSGNGQFSKPKGVQIKNKRIFVVDSGNHRIQIFNIDDIFK